MSCRIPGQKQHLLVHRHGLSNFWCLHARIFSLTNSVKSFYQQLLSLSPSLAAVFRIECFLTVTKKNKKPHQCVIMKWRLYERDASPKRRFQQWNDSFERYLAHQGCLIESPTNQSCFKVGLVLLLFKIILHTQLTLYCYSCSAGKGLQSLFVPGNENSQERTVLGTNVPGNE